MDEHEHGCPDFEERHCRRCCAHPIPDASDLDEQFALEGAIEQRAAQGCRGDSIEAEEWFVRKHECWLRHEGDGFFLRAKYHAHDDGSMSEQINRDNGYMQGAPHLTWNYAAELTALFERKK